jgi:hypothetical protein
MAATGGRWVVDGHSLCWGGDGVDGDAGLAGPEGSAGGRAGRFREARGQWRGGERCRGGHDGPTESAGKTLAGGVLLGRA